jgi:hypothetical protein
MSELAVLGVGLTRLEGHSRSGAQAAWKDGGANSQGSKPITSDEFLQAAKTRGVYWLGLNIRAEPVRGAVLRPHLDADVVPQPRSQARSL